jgi:predicted alpha/beta-hydrolase family hydrolase
VLCLAFPLRPPRRPQAPSRLGELLAVDVPILVVQGERDPFGAPADFPDGVEVVAVAGDHSLRRSTVEVAAAVADWLDQRVA